MQKHELALILNPGSGSNDADFVQQVRQALEKSGRKFLCLETHPDEGAAPAISEAIERGVDTVIVGGGDGTVMSAVNAIGKANVDIRLAIVPGGTANLVARALGVPLDVEGAVAVALDGDERRIDLGECGSSLFALGLGLGLTEKLVSGASAEEKERLGKWAYVKALLEEVGAHPSTFTYKIDDAPERSEQGVAIVVANAGTLSGRIEFAPGAQMDDGKLDMVILHRLHARDLVRLLWKSLFGSPEDDRAMTCLAGRSIEIKCDPPLDLQIDGEKVDTRPPLQIEVRSGALRVAVPSKAQKASLGEKLGEAIAKPVTEIARSNRWPWVVAGASAIVGTLLWKSTRRR